MDVGTGVGVSVGSGVAVGLGVLLGAIVAVTVAGAATGSTPQPDTSNRSNRDKYRTCFMMLSSYFGLDVYLIIVCSP